MSEFAQDLFYWQSDNSEDAKQATWAWAVALIAGGYATGITRSWDVYFANRGIL